MDGVQTSEQTPAPERTPPPAGADTLEGLSRFEGPPEQFLAHLLALQCRMVRAEGGAIFRASPGQDLPDILAVHPPPAPNQSRPDWLAPAAQAAKEVVSTNQGQIVPVHEGDALYGQPARRHVILLPLRSEAGPSGAAGYCVPAGDPRLLADLQGRLEVSTALLSLYEVRLTLQRRQVDFRRLRAALEILAAVNEHDRFQASSMALCNEIASRHQCDRVSLGFHKGRYVILKAMSHTEKYSRKMKLIQDVEAAMEECFDQDLEVFYPAPETISFVSRAATELSTRHGPTSVLSIPLRREGKALAVLTLERPLDRPFGPQEIETLRLTGELVTPRLAGLYQTDRWAGAKVAGGLRKGFAFVLGSKHTWVKLLAIGILAFAMFLVFWKGPYRAEAPCVIQAVEVRTIPAPFEGYIAEAGDWMGQKEEIPKGTVLATLETQDIELQLAEALAERNRYRKEADAARKERKTAQMQIAEAQVEQAQARINRLNERKAKSTIRMPVTGRVISGDLRSQLGAPVKTGDKLYEVAPLASLRAELSVPEDLIGEVKIGMKGELATAAHPKDRVHFVVERINPVADVVSQRNVFKVRVRFDVDTLPDWMKPGMEGLGKIDVGEETYGYMWTRRVVNWVRMKLWF